VAVVVVPRWMATLMGEHTQLPLGEIAWEDTCVDVSPVRSAALTDVLSARPGNVERHGEQSLLRLADALAVFPVAVLHGAAA
jgi:hypothetical protein